MQKLLFDISSIPWVGVQRRPPPPSKKLSPVSFPSVPLAWQQPEQQAKVCRFFSPSQAAFSWQQPRAILKAAKFTEEHSEIASSELGVYFQAALLQQGRAEGQSSAVLSLCMIWATGAKTGGSRQGFGQEAALGECGLIPLLNPSLHDHRLEGILKEAKKEDTSLLYPHGFGFSKEFEYPNRFFYSAQATHSQHSPFLVPSFHLPDPLLTITEPHLAFLKAKPQKKTPIQFKHSTCSSTHLPSERFGRARTVLCSRNLRVKSVNCSRFGVWFC